MSSYLTQVTADAPEFDLVVDRDMELVGAPRPFSTPFLGGATNHFRFFFYVSKEQEWGRHSRGGAHGAMRSH